MDVACGQQHTLVCSSIEERLEPDGEVTKIGGTVFTFGLGALGQLGHGTAEGSLVSSKAARTNTLALTVLTLG